MSLRSHGMHSHSFDGTGKDHLRKTHSSFAAQVSLSDYQLSNEWLQFEDEKKWFACSSLHLSVFSIAVPSLWEIIHLLQFLKSWLCCWAQKNQCSNLGKTSWGTKLERRLKKTAVINASIKTYECENLKDEIKLLR